tara:strand:+ start:2907 stop:3230 length:324 start_codon:yes stop_codon:yes gene_type:complete
MTAWTDTVKKTFKQGRLSNPAYQFKDALKDAKKIYKKGEVALVDAAKKTRKVVGKVAKKTGKAMRKTGKAIKIRLKKRSSKRKTRKHGKSRKYKKRGGDKHQSIPSE